MGFLARPCCLPAAHRVPAGRTPRGAALDRTRVRQAPPARHRAAKALLAQAPPAAELRAQVQPARVRLAPEPLVQERRAPGPGQVAADPPARRARVRVTRGAARERALAPDRVQEAEAVRGRLRPLARTSLRRQLTTTAPLQRGFPFLNTLTYSLISNSYQRSALHLRGF